MRWINYQEAKKKKGMK